MPDSLIKWLLANPDAGYAGYLLVTLLLLSWAFGTEKFRLGRDYRKLETRCNTTEATLAEVQGKLVDQRILNERSTAKIEAQAQDIIELQVELARVKGVLGRLGDKER